MQEHQQQVRNGAGTAHGCTEVTQTCVCDTEGVRLPEPSWGLGRVGCRTAVSHMKAVTRQDKPEHLSVQGRLRAAGAEAPLQPTSCLGLSPPEHRELCLGGDGASVPRSPSPAARSPAGCNMASLWEQRVPIACPSTSAGHVLPSAADAQISQWPLAASVQGWV